MSGTRVRGTDTENACSCTSCSLADYSEPGCSRGLGKYVAVVHGVNLTTGNDARTCTSRSAPCSDAPLNSIPPIVLSMAQRHLVVKEAATVFDIDGDHGVGRLIGAGFRRDDHDDLHLLDLTMAWEGVTLRTFVRRVMFRQVPDREVTTDLERLAADQLLTLAGQAPSNSHRVPLSFKDAAVTIDDVQYNARMTVAGQRAGVIVDDPSHNACAVAYLAVQDAGHVAMRRVLSDRRWLAMALRGNS